MFRPFLTRRAMTLALASAVCGAVLAAGGPGFVLTFDDDAIGGVPSHVLFSSVRQPSAGLWAVRGNAHHHVLTHTADPALGGRSVATADLPAPQDLRVSTRVRFVDGAREGGLVWRYRNGHNGYVAGVSLLRREAFLFRVTAGNRVQLSTLGDLNIDPQAWHTLSVAHQGDDIRVHLDGIAVLHARDSASESGGAGVWSAGAAQTWFDDLHVEPLPELAR